MQARSASGVASTRFARELYFPVGWETSLAQFLELFHRFGYIYKPLSGGSWYSADEKWKLTDSEILKAIACAHQKYFLGCRAGKSTKFAVLDIDANSRYHNKTSLDKLLGALAQAGLGRSSLFRSSYSGGWHLYIFFDEPINSTDLRRQLVRLLTLHDFDVAKGTLEIFPHPSKSSLGMGLRLPLQPGFAWLDKQTLDIEHDRSDLDATTALELFVDLLDGDSNSYAAFRHLKSHLDELESRKESVQARARNVGKSNVIPLRQSPEPSGDFLDFVRAVFHRLPPGIIADTWYKGRVFHLNGLTAPSQRAEAIFCLGHYLFYGDPSRDLPALGYGYEQEREWAIKEFLSFHHNGQSKDINRGRADAIAQVERAAHWMPAHKKDTAPKKYSPERPIAWIRENENRKQGARQRIADALDTLKQQGRSFTTVELREAAGCSRETLYSHKDIWRKDYDDLAEGFFAICTDEYNAVVGAASSESKPPTTPLEPDMPPGRLAARRIAYELSMRAQRTERHELKKKGNEQLAAAESWRQSIKDKVPEDLSSVDLHSLKPLIVFLVWMLGHSPSYEDQIWLSEIISSVRHELAARDHELRPPNKHPPWT